MSMYSSNAIHSTLTPEWRRQTEESDELQRLRGEIKWMEEVILDAAEAAVTYELLSWNGVSQLPYAFVVLSHRSPNLEQCKYYRKSF